jgi:TonB-dependent starch-binding outer membrane protein SusC
MYLTAFLVRRDTYLRNHKRTNILCMVKLTTILLLACCMHLSAKSFGQHLTISKTNAELPEIFLDIYRQTGFYFMCKDDLLENAKKVTIRVKDATLQEVLEICFRNQPLEYTISDHVIVVSKKTILLIDVKGRVVNDKDIPLAETNIAVKNSSISTATDGDGIFILHHIEANAVLNITHIGYEAQEIAIEGNTQPVIRLVQSISKLDEVQIIAYGTTTRMLDIGDIGSVSAETIAQQPVSNPLEALEGRVAGLQVTQQTGVPGGAFTVLIRGQNSIANGNNPLYIIDGVQFTGTSISSNLVSGGITGGGNPLSSMNPADIESVVILKDADATSIYGSRGANGVILITTKMGKAGKTNVDLNVYTGVGQVAHFMPLLNTPQYLTMRREAFQNDGEQPNPYVDYDLLSWDTTRYTNWQKTLYGGNASILNAQGSVSGGNQNTQFILSGAYNRQGTVFPGSFNYQKASGHAGINHSSKDQRFKCNS